MLYDINFKGLTPAHEAVLNATASDIDLIKLFMDIDSQVQKIMQCLASW